MATVKEIKEEMEFSDELSELLEVMKNIAVFQFRTLQHRKERFTIFLQSLKDFFRIVDFSRAPSIFLNPKTDRLGIVMITSDEGFMGSLNFQVINMAIGQKDAVDAELIIVGERGARYLEEINKKYVSFKGVADYEGRYRLSLALTEHVMQGIIDGRFGRVIISYPNPVSFMIQQVEIVRMLPVAAEFSKTAPLERKEDILIESPFANIVEYLVRQLLAQKLNDVLEDSKLSEYAARALHLEKSGQEIAERKKHLKLQYFHAYHERIDKNIRELFSSQIIRRKDAACGNRLAS